MSKFICVFLCALLSLYSMIDFFLAHRTATAFSDRPSSLAIAPSAMAFVGRIDLSLLRLFYEAGKKSIIEIQAASPETFAKRYQAEAKKNYRPSIPQHAKPLVILDAGHGGSDEGAKVHFFQEKKVALSTVLLLKKYLDEMGYRVILTRSRDVYIPLHRRVSIANRTRAVLFVSVHYNASQSREAKGIEVFYCPGEDTWKAQASKRLASSILSHLVNHTQADSRGVKAGNFHVIRETQMPAVLVEAGFITNLEERSFLRDKNYLEKVAKGIATGIDKYLKG